MGKNWEAYCNKEFFLPDILQSSLFKLCRPAKFTVYVLTLSNSCYFNVYVTESVETLEISFLFSLQNLPVPM